MKKVEKKVVETEATEVETENGFTTRGVFVSNALLEDIAENEYITLKNAKKVVKTFIANRSQPKLQHAEIYQSDGQPTEAFVTALALRFSAIPTSLKNSQVAEIGKKNAKAILEAQAMKKEQRAEKKALRAERKAAKLANS